ncbi:MAG TPA: LamG-like jellyroll fold domain-containing protein [Candidatus Baltobacteraceae bacterium]|nr:LamG-like jellyroll fold domain-containing protein [Candidatus Baltobacteraceae bacterium]
MASGAQSDQYSAVILADAPTAYYRLDDSGSSAADSSGHGLNGTIGSSVTLGVPGLLAAVSDTAIALPGTGTAGATVNVPANVQLQPPSAVSVEAWIKFSATPRVYTVPVAYGSDTSYAPYDLLFRSGGQIAAQFYLSSGVLEIDAPFALAANTPYHIVSTYDGTAGHLYINGPQVATASKSGTITNYQSKYGLTIGDDAAFSDPPFAGIVDEVAVYANKALSPGQVLNHYQAGTVVQNPSATPSPTPTPGPTPMPGPDWLTMGSDLQRTGYNSFEHTIGTGSFSTLHKVWSKSLGGVDAEPVYATNVDVAGTAHNVLYAGTTKGMFYAFDADNGNVMWSKQLGVTVHTCGSANYTFGVMGAAAIDRVTNRIYVPDGTLAVHALDLGTGAESAGWPITIGQTPDHNFIYAGLTFNPANHLLYAETSATCDVSPWYGRIAAIDTAMASIVNTFFPAQGNSGGGIWGFGGASIDPANENVFIATGNADTSNGASQNAYYTEQIVELSADLNPVIQSNLPNIPGPGHDYDFGATPLLYQPLGCPPLLAALNKSGIVVIYNRTDLDAGALQNLQISISSGHGDLIGVPAYDPVTNMVYIGLPSTYKTYRPGIAAFSITSQCTLDPQPAWSARFGADGSTSSSDTPRSPITIANGVVYVSDYVTKQTYAFNAASGHLLWNVALGGAGIAGPVVANGKLYIGSTGTTMTAWSP